MKRHDNICKYLQHTLAQKFWCSCRRSISLKPLTLLERFASQFMSQASLWTVVSYWIHDMNQWQHTVALGALSWGLQANERGHLHTWAFTPSHKTSPSSVCKCQELCQHHHVWLHISVAGEEEHCGWRGICSQVAHHTFLVGVGTSTECNVLSKVLPILFVQCREPPQYSKPLRPTLQVLHAHSRSRNHRGCWKATPSWE